MPYITKKKVVLHVSLSNQLLFNATLLTRTPQTIYDWPFPFQTVQSGLRESPKLAVVDGVLERDEFVEEEAELSALRRYQYNELVDYEDENDEKEYYI